MNTDLNETIQKAMEAGAALRSYQVQRLLLDEQRGYPEHAEYLATLARKVRELQI